MLRKCCLLTSDMLCEWQAWVGILHVDTWTDSSLKPCALESPPGFFKSSITWAQKGRDKMTFPSSSRAQPLLRRIGLGWPAFYGF